MEWITHRLYLWNIHLICFRLRDTSWPACIRRRNLMRELEDMSYKDALTGFGNRFAMNRYISQIDHKREYGEWSIVTLPD